MFSSKLNLKFISSFILILYMGSFFRIDHVNAATSPIYTCPGPYACVISTYLGIQFPDGSQQQTAYVGGAGLTGVGTIDSTTPSANGAAAPGNLLIMQSASSTRPGLVNNAAQTFSGAKTFSSNIIGNLTGTASGNVLSSLTLGTTAPLAGGGDLSTNRTLSITQATTSTNGYLSSVDWNTFNGKQSTLTLGNLTDAGTDGITVTGGTGSVVGSGTSISQRVADSTHNGYLSSTDWSTFNSKQASGSYITALTGDVSASGPGSAASTVNSVGGSTASNVNSATVLANASTSANTVSTIVRRDSSGDFSAGTITAALTGTASGNPPNARTISTSAPLSGGGDLSANRSLSISQATTSTDGYLSSVDWNTFNGKQSTLTIGDLTDAGTDGITVTGGTGSVIGSGTSLSQRVADSTHNGYLSSSDWSTFNGKTSGGITALTGDVTASGPGSSAATVALVGGSTASAVNTATIAANAATDANTVSTIVKRDGSGNFSAGTISAALTGTASGNTTYTPNQYGIVASGSGNTMSVIAPDASASKLLKSGGASANPSWLAYTDSNTASTVVARDGSGNFSAGTITASLTGTASGNATLTPNNHGVALSGSANALTVLAPDASASKVLKSGGASADPSWLAYDNANTVSTLVARDGSGNFSAGTITAALTGTASGNTAYSANNHGVVISGSANTMTVLAPDASTSKVLTSGGTGADPTWSTVPASGSATPTASTNAQWDANVNMSSNSFLPGYLSTASSAGTLTLTVASSWQQYITGTNTHTVVLPVVSTMVNGQSFQLYNQSTQNVAVQSSGANTIVSMRPGTQALFTVISTSGTGVASWSYQYINNGPQTLAINYIPYPANSSSTGWISTGGTIALSTDNTAANSPRNATNQTSLKIASTNNASSDSAYYPFQIDQIDYNQSSYLYVEVPFLVSAAADIGQYSISLGQSTTFGGAYSSISGNDFNNPSWALVKGMSGRGSSTSTKMGVFSTCYNLAAAGTVAGNFFALTINVSSVPNAHFINLSNIYVGPPSAAYQCPGQTVGSGGSTNALVGNVGEIKTATGSAVSVTTSGFTTITSITVANGDWDVTGMIYEAGTASVTSISGGIATATNSNTGWTFGTTAGTCSDVATIGCTVSIIPVQKLITATSTTYYLTAAATGATASISGTIRARRVR